jgi:phosphoglycerate dehydrogenase-like enzyme
MAETIVVTELEYGKGEAVFRAAVSDGFRVVAAPRAEADLARVVQDQGARYAVVGVDPYRDRLYDALAAGGLLARYGVGHDGIDKDRATAAGVLCTNTPGALDDSVAEHVMGLMLAAARHVPEVNAAFRAGHWAPRQGHELRGKRLAVIGCGPIGCRVARMAAFGFGMDVVGCEVRQVDTDALRRDYGFRAVVAAFESAVAGAAFVSLHIPGTPGTRHFVNAERLHRIAPGAWLINTARGVVVDETALYDALADGHLAGAALDVFESEPFVPVRPDKDLRTLANVVLTPHISSSTVEACERVTVQVLKNVRLAQARRYEEMDLLNPGVVAKLRG